jgi:mRNA interferase RelE/StbE
VSPSYKVSIGAQAQRQLDRIDTAIRRRILAAIATLGEAPFPAGAKALKGRHGQCRIRVAKDWRVIYEVSHGQLLVIVVEVGHRGDVYD